MRRPSEAQVGPKATDGSRRIQYLILVGMIVFLVLLAGFGLFRWFNTHDQVAIWDFHPRWLGLRLLFTEGANPYSQEVTEAIQQEMYGRLALPNEDQIAFAYPLPVMVLVGPLALLPLPVAQALWLLLLATCLLLFLFLAPRAVGWRPPAWLLALTTLFGIGLYPNAWAILLGQVSIVIALLMTVTWWSLHNQRWTVAGICLALTAIKPQMVFLVIPWLLIWALFQRQWRFLAAFAVSCLVLASIPLVWLSNWPAEWLAAAGRYAGYTSFEPPLQLLTGSPTASIAGALILLGWSFWCWRRADRDTELSSFDWAFSLVILINALIAPRTSQANQLILLLPMFFLFSRLRLPWVIAALQVALLVGLWWIDAQWLPPVNSPQHVLWQHHIISPILPVGLTLCLLALSPCMPWIRRPSEADGVR